MLFEHFLGAEARRKRLLPRAPEGAVRDFLEIPFPHYRTPLDRVPILALDFETTGLNPVRDHILSIGAVVVERLEIQLATAYHQVICTEGALHEAGVIVHHITDDHKAQGEALERVLPELLQQMAGKALLVHYAPVERRFLQQTCLRLYGMAPVFPIIDTMEIARRRLDQRTALYSPQDLRLFNLRGRHNLPRYKAHNALNDAIATAELLLAELELKQLAKPPALGTLTLPPWSR
ncbi:MAG: DNA polymerase III subunit epsilon [Gammaproteobacteria bacterium]|nr:DNA polymerase III subunit epsilon [Gammaproteobacteria bacterium]